jgi:hypothetical protein
MPNFVGHGSPPAPENLGSVRRRWEYRLGEILHLSLAVAVLTPPTDESTSDPALIGSTAPRLDRETSDRLEARALGRWAWEGGRTY